MRECHSERTRANSAFVTTFRSGRSPVFKHYYSQPLTSINLQLNVIVSGVEGRKKEKPLPVHFFHLFLFFSSSWGSCLDTDTHALSASTPPPSPHPLRSSIKHTAASWRHFFMQRCEVRALERPGSCPSSLPLSFYLFADAKSITLSICFLLLIQFYILFTCVKKEF